MTKRINFLLSSHNASILQRVKQGYLLWLTVVTHMPRHSRYTIGMRIEETFLDLLEQTYKAYFAEKENKGRYISRCVLTLDTLKFLLSVAWEGRLISHGHVEQIMEILEEAGRMFGGWKKNLIDPEKKNRVL